MFAVQIPGIVFGGIDSIVCVLYKSAMSDIEPHLSGSLHAVLFRH